MNKFLKVAVELAQAVDPHLTSPNPRVGCVVVQGDQIVSQGVHEYFSGPHAEANAFKPGLEPGLDVYITLEPCDHFTGKKTPSCTETLISLKPNKVFVGSLDPKFQGKNLEKIKSAGIEVEVVDCTDCRALNPFLEKWHSDSPHPYVTLKIAQSLDGKITSPNKYITNEASRTKVHELRAQYHAVLTSTETIAQDDPELNVRLCAGSDPKVVIVGERELDPNLRVFSKLDHAILRYKNHDLDQILRDLKKRKVGSVLLEVGQTLNTEFFKAGLVDEVQIFTAPVFLGNEEKASFSESVDLSDFKLAEREDFAGDVWLRYLKF